MALNGLPKIDTVQPRAALPGGELTIRGSGFGTRNHARPLVEFGGAEGSLVLAGDNFLVARVPEGAEGGALRVKMGEVQSAPFPLALGAQVADNLHPVSSPAVDADGNTYVTFSGQRGQKVPVSLYKITSANAVKPFITEMMNPTGLAIDRDGFLFVSSRNDGTIHRVSADGRAMQWIEGMGIATGLAFDKAGNLYVGDRSGTIFKINPEREIFVFATLEPSLAAYHLAFSPADELVRHRAHHFQFRPRASHQSRRRGQHVFSRAGASPRLGVRSRRESLRGGFAGGQTRHSAYHAAG